MSSNERGLHRLRSTGLGGVRLGRYTRRLATTRREASAGAAIVLLIAAFSWLGPLVWRLNPLAVNLSNALLAPSRAHPFGTDQLGRDLLSEIMSAGQLDLVVALAITVAGGIVGCSIGLVAGLRGHVVDNVTMRLIDSLLAFPPLILALAISVALGAGTIPAALGITISTVPFYARLMRSEVIRVQALPYVEAAVVSGGRPAHIVRRHVLPHTLQVIGVQASSVVGYAVLTFAALGFVGLGVQPPTPEWGTLITTGLSYVLSGQWWIGALPGVMLLALVVGCNLVADGLGGSSSRVVWIGGGVRSDE